MEELTPEQIREMFRDFALEREEERASFRQLSGEPSETIPPSTQLFIRIVASTSPEEEGDHAKLA